MFLRYLNLNADSFNGPNIPLIMHPPHMTGLLHEGIFDVQGLIQPAIFGSLPWAYMMCNQAQILKCWRHYTSR